MNAQVSIFHDTGSYNYNYNNSSAKTSININSANDNEFEITEFEELGKDIIRGEPDGGNGNGNRKETGNTSNSNGDKHLDADYFINSEDISAEDSNNGYLGFVCEEDNTQRN